MQSSLSPGGAGASPSQSNPDRNSHSVRQGPTVARTREDGGESWQPAPFTRCPVTSSVLMVSLKDTELPGTLDPGDYFLNLSITVCYGGEAGGLIWLEGQGPKPASLVIRCDVRS